MKDDIYQNSVLVIVDPDQAEHVLGKLVEHVSGGDFARFAEAKPLAEPKFCYRQDVVGRTNGVIVDFETVDGPMLSLDLECLLERILQWGGGHESFVHNIFIYPEGHPGNEPGKRKHLNGRAYGDVVVSSSLREGIGVSTFSNVLPEWGVQVDRW